MTSALPRRLPSLGSLLVLFLLLPLLAASPIRASSAPVQASSYTHPAELADPKELEQFLDQLVPPRLGAYNVPGLVISVVKDGQLVLAKGYGAATLASDAPVVADRTLFRIGSVTKLFVWTAVMQLVEQGKLNLDADVNTYLDKFKIPNTFPEPITLKHLMTHTAGFEEKSIDGALVAADATNLQPLAEVLERKMPQRVRRPGQFSSYSNYSAALAGYIVQVVSGVPFEKYVEDNIIKPLEMTRTSVAQPVAPDLAGDLATGYLYGTSASLTSAEFKLKPQPFDYLAAAPAGAISSTASDMANFMIAHLQKGQFKDRRILQESSVARMQAQQFSLDPRVNGITLGFMEYSRNGRRMIQHEGYIGDFYAKLLLIPDQSTGLFIALNSSAGRKTLNQVTEGFIDHYFPGSPVAVQGPPVAGEASRVAGSFRIARRNWSTVEKYINQIDTLVSANADGTIEVDSLNDVVTGKPIHWTPTAPLLFTEVGGQDQLVFKADGQGQITLMMRTSNPPITYERQPSHMSGVMMGLSQAVPALVFLLTLLAWPAGAVVRRLAGKKADARPLARRARYLALGVSALFLAAIALVFAALMGGVNFAIPPSLTAGVALATIASILTAALVVVTFIAWRQSFWGIAGRVHFTLVTLAAVWYTWFANEWNLILFRF